MSAPQTSLSGSVTHLQVPRCQLCTGLLQVKDSHKA